MPKVGQVTAPKPSLADLVENAMATFRAEFIQSRRGNLWRRWGRKTVTIFRSERTLLFLWSIADGAKVRYSRHGWATVEDALEDAAWHLGVFESIKSV